MPFNDIKIVEVDKWMEQKIYESSGNFMLNLCESVISAADYQNLFDQTWHGLNAGCNCLGRNQTNLREPDAFIPSSCNMPETEANCKKTYGSQEIKF